MSWGNALIQNQWKLKINEKVYVFCFGESALSSNVKEWNRLDQLNSSAYQKVKIITLSEGFLISFNTEPSFCAITV